MDPATRSNVIGRLQPGQSQTEVARQLNFHQNTISQFDSE
jgi:transposase-like protein